MPARPFVPGVAKVVLQGTVGTHPWAVVLHSSYTGTAPTASFLSTVAAAMGTAWGTSYKPEVSNSIVLTSVIITDLASALGAQGISSPNITGTNANSAAGGNSAVLVTYPSSIRYRGGHPRSYLPPPPGTSLQTTSTITSAYITAVTTAWNAVLAPLFGTSGGGTTMAGQCAISYVTAKAPRVTPVVMPISQNAITVQAELGSQRRRIGRK